ncbi:MAG: biotin-dependent carboxyltransferase [Deltaproteobacteria bacterium]|nr:biotin-dependent carboxyltransferase [Deltaproteobacteria bacterium]
MLNVLDGGLQTTVQDAGRFGWYHIGMPPAGAMDQLSFRVGNRLVGNADGAAALEITFAGPVVETTEEAVVAVTGAGLDVRVNGTRVPRWVAHRLRPGDQVACGQAERGVRAYLCVAGGIAIPPLLGSRSTYLLARFGGVEGRRLQAGDRLPVGPVPPQAEALIGRMIPSRFLPALPRDVELRIIMGLCSYRLTADSAGEFLAATWEVSTEADRVGYRLRGPALRFRDREPPFGAGSDASNVVDVGYPVGSVQVPGGQEAILLMRDAVTGGGYATIGTVIHCDLDRLAQAPPGSKVTFRSVDVDEAMRARREYRARIAAIAESLSLFDRVGLFGP